LFLLSVLARFPSFPLAESTKSREFPFAFPLDCLSFFSTIGQKLVFEIHLKSGFCSGVPFPYCQRRRLMGFPPPPRQSLSELVRFSPPAFPLQVVPLVLVGGIESPPLLGRQGKNQVSSRCAPLLALSFSGKKPTYPWNSRVRSLFPLTLEHHPPPLPFFFWQRGSFVCGGSCRPLGGHGSPETPQESRLQPLDSSRFSSPPLI